MCTGFTTEASNPTTHHILTGYLCSSYLLYLFHLRGGLASVAITPNHPIGLWNMTLPSYLSVCLFTFISSAIPSGSDFMCKGLCHGRSTAACSQTLMWHLILKNKKKCNKKKKALQTSVTWVSWGQTCEEDRGIPHLTAVIHLSLT